MEKIKLLKNKYPDRVPVIIKNKETVTGKYLVPISTTMKDLFCVVKHKLNEKQAIFIFVNNCLVPMNNTIGEIYNQHQADDGILYLVYRTENTFG
jgi:hypothetical protein